MCDFVFADSMISSESADDKKTGVAGVKRARKDIRGHPIDRDEGKNRAEKIIVSTIVRLQQGMKALFMSLIVVIRQKIY